jgi:hypothetical protein
MYKYCCHAIVHRRSEQNTNLHIFSAKFILLNFLVHLFFSSIFHLSKNFHLSYLLMKVSVIWNVNLFNFQYSIFYSAKIINNLSHFIKLFCKYSRFLKIISYRDFSFLDSRFHLLSFYSIKIFPRNLLTLSLISGIN